MLKAWSDARGLENKEDLRYKAGSDIWKLGKRSGRSESWRDRGPELRRMQESYEAKPTSLANAVDNIGSR